MSNRWLSVLQERIEGSLIVPNETLKQIYDSRVVIDEQNKSHALHSQISAAHANALYRTVIAHQPKVVVEVGMAYGISSLAIATALHELGQGGRLISIDPAQMDYFDGLGVLNIKRAGFSSLHEMIPEPDYLTLPRLLEQETVIDFAYIDGIHVLDYALLDFFYIDKMLKVDGVVGFNDCALPSVRQVLRFVTAYRKYQEIDVGLGRNYFSRNPLVTVQRFLTGISKADRYFQKIEDWERQQD